MLFKYLAANQRSEITTLNMYANFEKNNISALKNSIIIDNGHIKLPTFCDLLENVPNFNCKTKFIMQRVSIIFTTVVDWNYKFIFIEHYTKYGNYW